MAEKNDFVSIELQKKEISDDPPPVTASISSKRSRAQLGYLQVSNHLEEFRDSVSVVLFVSFI
jgi:hypothetical protein